MTTLDLQPRTWDRYTVLSPCGELDLHNQTELEQAVMEQLAGSSVVLDLAEVEFVAIAVLRSLMICHAQADATGRELVLVRVPRQAQRLLTLSGLDGVLPVRASVNDVSSTSTDQQALAG